MRNKMRVKLNFLLMLSLLMPSANASGLCELGMVTALIEAFTASELRTDGGSASQIEPALQALMRAAAAVQRLPSPRNFQSGPMLVLQERVLGLIQPGNVSDSEGMLRRFVFLGNWYGLPEESRQNVARAMPLLSARNHWAEEGAGKVLDSLTSRASATEILRRLAGEGSLSLGSRWSELGVTSSSAVTAEHLGAQDALEEHAATGETSLIDLRQGLMRAYPVHGRGRLWWMNVQPLSTIDMLAFRRIFLAAASDPLLAEWMNWAAAGAFYRLLKAENVDPNSRDLAFARLWLAMGGTAPDLIFSNEP